jgi:hypothetical protein
MALFGGLQFQQLHEVEEVVKKILNERLTGKRKTEKETTTKQQILILYYTGCLESLKMDTVKKAKLLAVLLNRGEDNIKKYLTYINGSATDDTSIKTIENLNAIIPLLELDGLNEALEKAKKDLGKLDKIKI